MALSTEEHLGSVVVVWRFCLCHHRHLRLAAPLVGREKRRCSAGWGANRLSLEAVVAVAAVAAAAVGTAGVAILVGFVVAAGGTAGVYVLVVAAAAVGTAGVVAVAAGTGVGSPPRLPSSSSAAAAAVPSCREATSLVGASSFPGGVRWCWWFAATTTAVMRSGVSACSWREGVQVEAAAEEVVCCRPHHLEAWPEAPPEDRPLLPHLHPQQQQQPGCCCPQTATKKKPPPPVQISPQQ
mmetsp:Transcript_53240/g.99066  ORF Transcript_53240/g.99066 Transcript_53240/m.99066 type:complete len:239 (+) Transcript_53240:626-1342(+)